MIVSSAMAVTAAERKRANRSTLKGCFAFVEAAALDDGVGKATVL